MYVRQHSFEAVHIAFSRNIKCRVAPIIGSVIGISIVLLTDYASMTS